MEVAFKLNDVPTLAPLAGEMTVTPPAEAVIQILLTQLAPLLAHDYTCKT